MRILKANCYAPDERLHAAFAPDAVFDIHMAAKDGAPAGPLSAEICRNADAIISCAAGAPLGVDVSAFERCRIVVREGVGYDGLDLRGWGARGVPVCNVPDYGTTEVADHALALALALLRGTATYQGDLRAEGRWDFTSAPLVRRLRGATFGIVGLGRIGLATARRASAFDMNVAFYDPYLSNGAELAVGYARARSLGELLERSDILTLHTPLTEETRGLIGARALTQAKPGLILVNTARGPIVDLDALAEAMRSGRVAGAGLDVLANEPGDLEHPLLAAWRRDEPWLRGRLALTPHAAFYSPAALEDMQRKAVEVVIAYVRDGQLMNCVNREFLAKS